MKFPVQLPCCLQFATTITCLKLIGSSYAPTTKTKTHIHSYFNKALHIGIRHKVDRKKSIKET